MTGKANIRMPGQPTRPPKKPPGMGPPPLTTLIVALTELVEVGTECLQFLLDEAQEHNK